MAAAATPRARLPELLQLPLDSIDVYDTATHCYLLGTDSLQKDFHLLTLRKHSPEQGATFTSLSNTLSNTSVATLNSSGGGNGGGGGGGGGWRVPRALSESELDDDRDGTFNYFRSGAFGNGGGVGLEDLHEFTSYAVYSPTEAAALTEALHREHGPTLRTLRAVAVLGGIRLTAGYYVVLATERRAAGHIGVHRLFEAVSVELVSLQLENDWVAAAEAQMQQRVRRSSKGGAGAGGGGRVLESAFSSFTSSAMYGSRRAAGAGRYARHASPAAAGAGAGASASSGASYLFQRRSLEELYRQQFLSSLSRPSSFFYSHSYDLTNTLQRNMLAAGAADAETGNDSTRGTSRCAPRMQYVWNEYLMEPWQLNTDHDADESDLADEDENDEGVDRSVSFNDSRGAGGVRGPAFGPSRARQRRDTVPQYPPGLSRWCVLLIHGYVIQRVVVVRRPDFHTLLLTLIARVSKASAGVRYLRRGLNSDGHVANHVEVEQIVSDESSWNSNFTAGALSSYVQLRGSVPVRWYHPPGASRLQLKPPIVLGPQDPQWTATCLHFQDLLEQYGSPILVHDLLKCKESSTRETALGEAYQAAVRALVAALDRAAAAAEAEKTAAAAAADEDVDSTGAPGPSFPWSRRPPPRQQVLQYESTDLRSLGQLAWNTMTALAEQHFHDTGCFVCRRCPRRKGSDASLPPAYALSPHHGATGQDMGGDELYAAAAAAADVADAPAVAVRLQSGVVRSNCLDCIDRTNLGQLFHGLHALGEQLAALGLLRHAADVRDSPALNELLLEMYLAMGDAIAIQYGGSALVGAGVLHRGAGWDQLMGVKRLYNNTMGDRDKLEAMNLLLGRKQPQPRRSSRARNADMCSPGQLFPLSLAQALPSPSTAPSLSASMTSASPGVAAALSALSRGAPPSREPAPTALPSSPSAASAAPTPAAATSSNSFLAGLRQVASRWFGDGASSARTSASAGAAAAAAAALRAAQHAAAEAEAEADYYEQVSGAPRLPPAGLLSTWWVQPMRRYAAWYAGCGVRVRGAADALPAVDYKDVPGAEGTLACALRAANASLEEVSGIEGGVPATRSATASPASMVSARSPAPAQPLPIPAECGGVGGGGVGSGASHSSGTVTYDDDVFARQLLADEALARVRRRGFLARLERQVCLAPMRGDGLATLRGNRQDAAAVTFSTSPAPQPSRRFRSPVAMASSLPHAVTAAMSPVAPHLGFAGHAVLPGSMSTLGLDDMGGMMVAVGGSRATMSQLGEGMPLAPAPGRKGSSGAPALGVRERYRGGDGDGSSRDITLIASMPSMAAVPVLTVPLTLFYEPWVMLRTSMHVLAVAYASDEVPARCEVAASRLCPSARQGGVHEGGLRGTPRKMMLGQPPYGAELAVARQLFGGLTDAMTAAAVQPPRPVQQQRQLHPWRSPPEVHRHDLFPRVVRASAFAQQEAYLEQLASREVEWMSDNAVTTAGSSALTVCAGEFGAAALTAAAARPISVGSPTNTVAHAAPSCPRTSSPSPPPLPPPGSTSGLPNASHVLSPQELTDRRFMAALLVDLLGAPAGWGVEDMLRAMQRLVYPERVPASVQQALRSPRLQPPLQGSELVTSAAAAAATAVGEGEVWVYWRDRLAGLPPSETRARSVRGAAGLGTTAYSRGSSTLRTPPRRRPGVGVGGSPGLQRRVSNMLLSPPSLPVAHALQDNTMDSKPAHAAVVLLCRLAAVLRHAPSISASHASPTVVYIMGSTTAAASHTVAAADGASDKPRAGTGHALPERLIAGALLPFAEPSIAAATRDRLVTTTAVLLPELAADGLRRQWQLCRLLQPFFPGGALTPPTLHTLLHDFFSAMLLVVEEDEEKRDNATEQRHGVCDSARRKRCPDWQQRQQRRRREYHVRYTFALSQQHRHSMQEQPQPTSAGSRPTLQLLGEDGGCGGASGCSGGSGTVFMGTSPSLSSPSPKGPLNTATASSAVAAAAGAASSSSASAAGVAAGSAAPRTLHIPATLKVRYCCAALDLYRWCVAHCPTFAAPRPCKAVVKGAADNGTASVTWSAEAARRTAGANTHVAAQAWHLLWWAVENSFVIPVVRRRGQSTLEMLADETALFCLLRDMARVALNVERSSRDDVWQPQRPEVRARTGVLVPGASAVYGVDLSASALPLQRPLLRGSLVGMLALSETLASLGLSAATQVQEFFRERLVHGWVRQPVGASGGGAVALFGGGAAAVAATAVDLSTPADGTVQTAATVVRRFHRLADDALQSMHGVMAALRHTSLAVLAQEDAPLHSHLSFFVNVFNAVYVAAWLTNVKELVSNGAAAATATTHAAAAAAAAASGGGDGTSPRQRSPLRGHSPAGGGGWSSQPSGLGHMPTPRTVDMLPLPTLCNTSHACFMHVYGIAIGDVFLSLAEMKYGILGGNRAPPYCDVPLWPPLRGDSRNGAPSTVSQRLVPLHLRTDVAEVTRMDALQHHPQLHATLDFADLCEAVTPSPRSAGDVGGAEKGESRTSQGERSPPPQLSGPSHQRTTSSGRGGGPRPQPPGVPNRGSSSSIDAAAAAAADSMRRSAQVSPTPVPLSANPSRGPALDGRDSAAHPHRRRQELVAAWSADVVRHVPFRLLFQLIDTYLPPPLLHLGGGGGGGVDGEGRPNPLDSLSGAGGAAGHVGGGGGGGGSTGSGGVGAGGGGGVRGADAHHVSLLDGRDRVPWCLHPLLNRVPLVHTTLQSSKLGAAYAVARNEDTAVTGTLAAQVSQDANGVLLQPYRMWSSPSYYVVGGDGMSGEEAISHSFQLLQALTGSYLGAARYHPLHHGTATAPTTVNSDALSRVLRAPAQHLCAPLHADEAFAQLHATEARFRSAMLTTDPLVFSDLIPAMTAASTSATASNTATAAGVVLTTPLSSATRPQAQPGAMSTPPTAPLAASSHARLSGVPSAGTASDAAGSRSLFGGLGAAAVSCSAALQNAMKPVLYEWCRVLEDSSSSPAVLTRPGLQVRATLKAVQLLEESYASGEAVRAAQAAVRLS